MNLKSMSTLLQVIFLFSSCDQNPCDNDVDEWIHDAPVALEEFQKLMVEIEQNRLARTVTNLKT
jgi:hypothetical protein